MQILFPRPPLSVQLRASHLKPARSSITHHLHPTSRSSAPSLDFQRLDLKWQKRWTDLGKREAKDGSPKAYVLAMFPYPSGTLHMGHLRVYTIADVLARFKRMQGHRLLYPMGWDAFGLPAENAAIERGLDPAVWTKSNVGKMKGQLRAMNGDIDWSREFMTCDPSFYKHTQRLFLLLHEHGLAYQAKSLVNYDPVDRTVLANEQVDANGFSWRSGAKVEKINLKQWFLRITAFKEALLDDLELLKDWPERVISMQRNWLGRSQGASVKFHLVDEADDGSGEDQINVFTTRPDTLFGVQYLCLSPKHPLVTRHTEHDFALGAFVESSTSLPPDSKVGYRLRGVHAQNPLGQVHGTPSLVSEPLPVFTSPYVLEGYGEGAIMGVPAHDARDWDFWKQNFGDIPARHVVAPSNDGSLGDSSVLDKPFTGTGMLNDSCGSFAGLESDDAGRQIINSLSSSLGSAEASETWKLRDWLISRQRYWGTPIPIIHCSSCGAVPVPVDQLPVELPKLSGDLFQHRAGNPLDSAPEWINTSCPKCLGPARRDTDTMDTFMDSSWYMYRFADSENVNEPFSPQAAERNMPVDVYLGGVEHAILHLLYARFIGKFLATTHFWPAGASKDVRGEPFKQLISQGMVHGKTFSDPESGRFLRKEELDVTDREQPRILASGKEPAVSFEKMSKSKHNGVDPTEFISVYGADVTRAHMLFQAPLSEVLEWEEERIAGVQRWFQRIWRLVRSISALLSKRNATETSPFQPFPFSPAEPSTLSQSEASLELATHRTIDSITTSLSSTHALNTCISDLMSLTNTLAQAQAQFESDSTSVSPSTLYHTTSALIKLLAPFAPAFAEECWEVLHSSIPHPYIETTAQQQHLSDQLRQSIFNHPWPTVDRLAQLELLASQREKQTCAVMENGKLRATVQIEAASDDLKGERLEEWVLAQIAETEEGKRWLTRVRESKGSERWWKRIVVVRGGRTVNFVG